MKTNPFDELPLTLTAEAEQDKKLWEVVIAGLHGKEKFDQITAFTARYKEMPRPISLPTPAHSFHPYASPSERWKEDNTHQ